MDIDRAFSVVEIILINTVLSGDNAVVIAVVAHGLPSAQRKRALLWGVGLAIAMQLVLTLLSRTCCSCPDSGS